MSLFVRRVKNGVQSVAFAALNRVFALCVPLKRDHVLFASDVREENGDSMAFVEKAMPKGLVSRYAFRGDRRINRGIRKWVTMTYDMSTCRYILLEDYYRPVSFMRVREGQEICQLWHAAGAYKKFGYSRLGNGEHIKVHKGYKKYAKAITSADAIRTNYAEAFGISMDKVKATGVPRTDIFFDEAYIAETKESIYKEYPVLREKKVILFAPTYRGLRAEDAAYDFSKLDPDLLYESLGEDYVFVFKWHPATYNNLKFEERQAYALDKYGDFFLDLSQERDINDLLLVADIMITDYSSVIFDYYLTGKPVVYYTYDLDAYEAGRGIYYPFEEYLYGPCVDNQADLIAAIRKADLCEDKRAAFGKKFMEACDGHATEKTCAWLFDGFIEETAGNTPAEKQR